MNQQLSAERLSEIEAREQAATSGPWSVVAGDEPDYAFFVCGRYPSDPRSDPTEMVIAAIAENAEITSEQAHKNALFMDYAREDIPDLIAAMRASQARMEQLEAVERAARKAVEHSWRPPSTWEEPYDWRIREHHADALREALNEYDKAKQRDQEPVPDTDEEDLPC